ncbi:hypothetical protein KP509_19G079400 [Ceratopteris richardii]|uniref:Uncharacterized protein n=1 Tax=Ceratopteris richardii TaxID=49495 RepID=A0A8T2SR78_CERRI|nr:hypothetical protein KP509_19G079400 [Ceratopteris richardii]
MMFFCRTKPLRPLLSHVYCVKSSLVEGLSSIEIPISSCYRACAQASFPCSLVVVAKFHQTPYLRLLLRLGSTYPLYSCIFLLISCCCGNAACGHDRLSNSTPSFLGFPLVLVLLKKI